MNRTPLSKVTPRLEAFKAALAAVMNENPLPLKAQFRELGVSDSYGYALADPHNLDTLPSVSRLFDILAISPSPAVVEFLARLQGHVCVPLPPPDAHPADGLAPTLRAFAGMVEEFTTAIADGHVSPRDAQAFEQAALRTVRAVLAQIEDLQARAAVTVCTRKVTA